MRPQSETVLVADVGGTNARFGLADANGRMLAVEIFPVAAYDRFDTALGVFLDDVAHRPGAACLAVAGPVTDGRAAFTNSPWTIDGRELSAMLNLSPLLVVNDFEALSRFALSRNREDTVCVKPGEPVSGAPVLTIGPGTGLGQALTVPSAAGAVCVPTEGGHALLPAHDAAEAALIAILRERFKRPPSVEDVLSGDGLSQLYDAIAIRDNRQVPAVSPAEITTNALGGDDQALETIRQFCAFLGTVAGDAALATGARGGVMLAGGILPRIQSLLIDGPFAERFVIPGPMQAYTAAIPVDLLIAGDAALRGAAFILKDRLDAIS
jgi:glucokinase